MFPHPGKPTDRVNLTLSLCCLLSVELAKWLHWPHTRWMRLVTLKVKKSRDPLCWRLPWLVPPLSISSLLLPEVILAFNTCSAAKQTLSCSATSYVTLIALIRDLLTSCSWSRRVQGKRHSAPQHVHGKGCLAFFMLGTISHSSAAETTPSAL